MDESALLARAVAGSLDAFNRLVEQYQSLAYSVAYRTLGDREAAADVTQDAFLAAYRGLGGFRGGSFKAWLLRIVANGCIDQVRQRQRRPSTSLDALIESAGDDVSLADRSPSPEGEALRGELVASVERALRGLPIDQRTVVVLCDLHGLTYEEIAEVTGASLGTVKSRLSRARSRLRDVLLAEPELLPGHFRQ